MRHLCDVTFLLRGLRIASWFHKNLSLSLNFGLTNGTEQTEYMDLSPVCKHDHHAIRLPHHQLFVEMDKIFLRLNYYNFVGLCKTRRVPSQIYFDVDT